MQTQIERCGIIFEHVEKDLYRFTRIHLFSTDEKDISDKMHILQLFNEN